MTLLRILLDKPNKSSPQLRFRVWYPSLQPMPNWQPCSLGQTFFCQSLPKLSRPCRRITRHRFAALQGAPLLGALQLLGWAEECYRYWKLTPSVQTDFCMTFWVFYSSYPRCEVLFTSHERKPIPPNGGMHRVGQVNLQAITVHLAPLRPESSAQSQLVLPIARWSMISFKSQTRLKMRIHGFAIQLLCLKRVFVAFDGKHSAPKLGEASKQTEQERKPLIAIIYVYSYIICI